MDPVALLGHALTLARFVRSAAELFGDAREPEHVKALAALGIGVEPGVDGVIAHRQLCVSLTEYVARNQETLAQIAALRTREGHVHANAAALSELLQRVAAFVRANVMPPGLSWSERKLWLARRLLAREEAEKDYAELCGALQRELAALSLSVGVAKLKRDEFLLADAQRFAEACHVATGQRIEGVVAAVSAGADAQRRALSALRSGQDELREDVRALTAMLAQALQGDAAAPKQQSAAPAASTARGDLATIGCAVLKKPDDIDVDVEADPIARGSGGDVFLATLRRSGESAVLKRCASEQQLRREASALYAMTLTGSPHWVRLLGVCERPRGLVLEFCEGGTLESALHQAGAQPPSLATRVDWCSQLVLAVAQLHSRSLVHRDLKPANILLRARPAEGKESKGETAAPVLVVADLGSTRSVGGGGASGATLVAGTAGTARWSAPELDDAGEEGARALHRRALALDYWSLGLVLVEIVTGRLPYADCVDDAALFAAKHDASRAPYDLAWLATQSPQLARVCAACCSRDPATRMDVHGLQREWVRVAAALLAPPPAAAPPPPLAPVAVAAPAPVEFPDASPEELVAIANALLASRVAADRARAVALLRRAASRERASAAAQCSLAAALEETDEAEALVWYQRAAAQRHAAAVFAVGLFHERGRGGLQRSAEASRPLFEDAAAMGYAGAQSHLGALLESAEPSRALDLLRRAAAQGNAAGLYHLGRFLDKGIGGVPASVERAIECWQRAAAQGHPRAEFALAACHHEGRGVARDLRAALALYRSAAARGLAEAEAALAGIARAGELGAANAREALALYTSAAEKGLAVAQHNLGIMLSTGEGGAPPDLAAALKWFSRAAEQGYAPSMLAVGQLIEHRSPADALQAVALFRRAADAGLAAAMLALGECLLAGRGVAPNAAEGAALVNRAAAARHPAAQFRLGQLHDQGGVLGARNTAAAAQLYAASASAGYVPALYAWGMCLLHGEGISAPDATQALQQLLAAAAKGHTLAMLQVGVCLASGVGTRADSAAAFAWFERAADAGLAAAQYNVAMMLKTGAHQSGLLGGVFQRGAPSDGVRVVENLRRAAEQGYAPAQLQLGLCYRDGLGMGLQSFALSRDKEEARRWLTLAARQGDPKAIAALREP